MIVKAASLDCASVLLDLEGAVPEEQKDQARQLIRRLSSDLDWGSRELCVRINQTSSSNGRRDVALLKGAERVDSVVVPKAEGGLERVHKRTTKSVIPLIETTRGLTNVEKILASDGVVAVSYGAADFALSVGGSVSEYLENHYVKSKIVIAARANGIEAIDNVFFDLNDMDGFRKQATHARALGYSGKQVIHPSQIPVANEVFAPSREEVEWARRVVKAYDEARALGKGAIRVDDRLVDLVHYRAAKQVLESGPLPGRS
jgi:citrate lyase subunit beta/citryl-CoA lyase